MVVVPRGTPAAKIAISVDADVHAGIVAAAADAGVSVSAWITEAARRALQVAAGLRAVAEWEAINGEFSEEELAAADRAVADRLAGATSPTTSSAR